MISKSDLQNYRSLVLELEDLKERIIRKESQITSARIQVLTGMPRGGNTEDDQMGSVIAALEEMKNEYVERLIQIESLQLKIETEIKKLGSIERLVIRWRYFDSLRWNEICARLDKSWKQVRLIHERSLRKLAQQNS